MIHHMDCPVWMRDVRRAHHLAQPLEPGAAWINDHHRIDPASPWGAFKDSGIHREHGRESLSQYLETPSVIANMDSSLFDWRGATSGPWYG
jgi:phenylacetaldehyde dehydrogenase